MSNKIEMFSTNGTHNPDIPRKPRKYSGGDDVPQKPHRLLITSVPKTDYSRFDNQVKAAREFNAGLALIHFRDERFSDALLEMLAFEYSQVHGAKI